MKILKFNEWLIENNSSSFFLRSFKEEKEYIIKNGILDDEPSENIEAVLQKTFNVISKSLGGVEKNVVFLHDESAGIDDIDFEQLLKIDFNSTEKEYEYYSIGAFTSVSETKFSNISIMYLDARHYRAFALPAQTFYNILTKNSTMTKSLFDSFKRLNLIQDNISTWEEYIKLHRGKISGNKFNL
jgi:hypothetical protein